MKREKGMSRGGRIGARIVFVLLAMLAVLQCCAVVVIGEWGVYNETKSRVEEEQLQALTKNCAKNVLRWYLYHDTEMAHENAAALYPETSINFEISVGEKKLDEIENVEGLDQDGYGIRYEVSYKAEEIMDEDELWQEVWVDEMALTTETAWETEAAEWDSATVQGYSSNEGRYELRVIENIQGYKLTEYSITCRVAEQPLYADDIVLKMQQAVDWAYEIRYPIIGGFFAALLGSVVLFLILVKKAGYVKGQEELQISWFDRIPFDLLLGCYLLAACILLFVTVDFGIGYTYVIQNIRATDFAFAYFIILGVGAGAAVAAFLTVIFFESISVRVKNGKWWKNTIVYHLLVWLNRIIRKAARGAADFVGQKLPLVWKAVLGFGLIAFVEFLVIVWTAASYEFGFMVFVWLLEKAVLLAGLILVLLQLKKLQEGGARIAAGDLEQKIETDRMFWEFKKHGENLNNIGVGIQHAVEERMKSERFKTELITNVSHDIKTPLTSIINYVDLLEKEDLQNSNAREYLEVLHRQSARLKKLIEDLMEASKASTGALAVNFEDCEVGVMLTQAAGEFEEKLKSRELTLLIKKPEEELIIRADGRHLWRVFDNLLNNIYKYSQPGTRVYLNLEKKEHQLEIIFRNTSKCELNISSEELQERFVRGDSSRNTEGSGLGLSIATSLTELMGGKFELVVDGDLFKVILTFPYQ